MNLNINTEFIEKENISLEYFFSLLIVYLGEILLNPLYLKEGYKDGYLYFQGLDSKNVPISLILTNKGKVLVERILDYKKENSTLNDRFLKLAEQLREIYPKGRKDGTNYMWRDSNIIIAKKLKSIYNKYGDCFTDEQAIEATKAYVQSFNGNYKYMQLLKYFISKKININGEMEETSQLLSYVENKDTIDYQNDWNTELI